MNSYARDNLVREFTKEVKKNERVAANYACRLCGKPKDLEWLQCAHIVSYTDNKKWVRSGTDSSKAGDDKYVGSEENCILLCQTHHGKVDSERGLQICTVEYLHSLKQDQEHCTALIERDGELRRCKNRNGRGNPEAKGNGYRCHLHLEGGEEESLPARTAWREAAKSENSSEKGPKKSSSSCIIL